MQDNHDFTEAALDFYRRNPDKLKKTYFGEGEAKYSRQSDRHPSLSWGFLLYAVRWHMNRSTQAQFGKILGIKQEEISRMELGKAAVPERVQSWLAAWLIERIGKPCLVGLAGSQYPNPSRTQRQRQWQAAHNKMGGGSHYRRKRA